MDPQRYRITFLVDSPAQLRSLIELSERLGRREEAVQSSRRIQRWLERAPNSFGESREAYPSAGLQMRIGFDGSISVRFAVHEESKTVFVRWFRWTARDE